jgi:hypothetical protein
MISIKDYAETHKLPYEVARRLLQEESDKGIYKKMIDSKGKVYYSLELPMKYHDPFNLAKEPTVKEELHESGLSMTRWNWPYKTPEERAIVAKYFEKLRSAARREEAKEKQKTLAELREAQL